MAPTARGAEMNGDSLRTEIVESQKFTVDLEKWKIILVAALGSVALGISNDFNVRPAVLALIPLVCAYVDVLVYHNGLRIMAISHFLQGTPGDEFAKRYEKFCEHNRRVFPLEEYALFVTTLVVSVAVGVFAERPALVGIALDGAGRFVVKTAALLGIVATTGARITYEWQVDNLKQQTKPDSRQKLQRIRGSIAKTLAIVVVVIVLGGLVLRLASSSAQAQGTKSPARAAGAKVP